MLTNVLITNSAGDSLNLTMNDPTPVSGYQITNIDGLGPVKADINSSSIAFMDGAVFGSASVGTGNIVLTMRFKPHYNAGETVQSLRAALYRYLRPKDLVTLQFTSDDHPTVKIQGYVEVNDPTIFDQNPSNQISIITMDPYFSAVSQTHVSGGSGSLTTEIDYEGSAEVGFTAVVDLDAAADTLALSVPTRAGTPSLVIGVYSFQVNDVVTIVTNRGSRSVTVKRGSTTTDITALTQGTWFGLLPTIFNNESVNSIVRNVASSADYYYTAKYEGI